MALVDAHIPSGVISGAVPDCLEGTVFTVGPECGCGVEWGADADADAGGPSAAAAAAAVTSSTSPSVHPLDREGIVTRLTFGRSSAGGGCHVRARGTRARSLQGELAASAAAASGGGGGCCGGAAGFSSTPPPRLMFTPNPGGPFNMLWLFLQHRGVFQNPEAADDGARPRHAYNMGLHLCPLRRQLHALSLFGRPLCIDPSSLTPFGVAAPARSRRRTGWTTGGGGHTGGGVVPRAVRRDGDGAFSFELAHFGEHPSPRPRRSVVRILHDGGGVTPPRQEGAAEVPRNTLSHDFLVTSAYAIFFASRSWSADFFADVKSVLRTSPPGMLRPGYRHSDAEAGAGGGAPPATNCLVIVPRRSVGGSGGGGGGKPPPPARQLAVRGFVAKFCSVVREGGKGIVVIAAVVCPDERVGVNELFAGWGGEGNGGPAAAAAAAAPAAAGGGAAAASTAAASAAAAAAAAAAEGFPSNSYARQPLELQLITVNLTEGTVVQRVAVAGITAAATSPLRGVVRPARYAYCTAPDEVIKYDMVTHTRVSWKPSHEGFGAFFAAATLFVPAAARTKAAEADAPEDDGYLLVQLNPRASCGREGHTGRIATHGCTHFVVLQPLSASIKWCATIRSPVVLPVPLDSFHTKALFTQDASAAAAAAMAGGAGGGGGGGAAAMAQAKL